MKKKKLRSCLFHWQKNVVVVQAFGCNYNSLAWCGRVERIAPHHAPQASKPKTGLSSWPGRESQKWLTSRREKCGGGKKNWKSGWRVAHCVVQLFKNRAQKAKPEVLCQSKATMAVLNTQSSMTNGTSHCQTKHVENSLPTHKFLWWKIQNLQIALQFFQTEPKSHRMLFIFVVAPIKHLQHLL